MKCLKCESQNVKRGSEGCLLDTYICQECHTVYERLTPTAKNIASTLGLAVITGPAGIPYIIHDR